MRIEPLLLGGFHVYVVVLAVSMIMVEVIVYVL